MFTLVRAAIALIIALSFAPVAAAMPSSSELGLPAIPGVTPRDEGPAPGSTDARQYFTNVWGKNRRYLVDLPANYNPTRAYPVLIGYSGRRQSAERFRGFSAFQHTPAARDAIRVYPQAWGQAWEGASYSTVRAGEDIAFTNRILDELQGRFNVDRSRVYAAGLSNGGTMAALVACKLPHRFRAVAIVSGLYFTPVTQGCRREPVAVKLMHGTLDGFSQFGGVSTGGVYLPVRNVLGTYIRRNGCAPNAPAAPIPNGTRTRYACSRAATQLVLTNKGHSWHLTDRIQDEIWNFLAAQR